MSNEEYDARIKLKNTFNQGLEDARQAHFRDNVLDAIAIGYARSYVSHLEATLERLESVIVGVVPTVRANEFHLDE